MIIQMGMSIRLIRKSQHCIARKGKCFDWLSTIGGGWSIGQELKHSIGQGMASKDFYLAPLRAATNFKAGDTGHQEE